MRHRLTLASLLIAFAASGSFAAQAADSTGTEASTVASADATANAIQAAPADKAQIVFFRPSKFVGGAFGFKVREGDNELGKLRSGKYFVSLVDPGHHQYTVHSEAKDVLDLEVEAGETYFVMGSMNMGVLSGRPNLAPSDEATFSGMASKLDRVE
ncbi:MAG TPA: DUF2846 domain-containing protein [Stenotrophomonas sp.]|jgi:hypothetical protein